MAETSDGLCRVLLWSLFLLVLIGVSGVGMWSLVNQEPRAPSRSSPRLPVYGTVPDFALLERSGDQVRLADLHGKIWITSFIFTNCLAECPLMTAEMARLQTDFAPLADVRLVSITVDPEHDTPAVLSEYATRLQADPQRWLFLTGDKGVIRRLARDGFRLMLSHALQSGRESFSEGALVGRGETLRSQWSHPPEMPRDGRDQFFRGLLMSVILPTAYAHHNDGLEALHSTRFVLVDRQGRIRGYYDSSDETALQRLRQHVRSLRREA